jgi:Flp pilus assembly protein TadG
VNGDDRATAPPCGRRDRGDHGQAAVELALALPVVVVLLLGVLQVALVGRDQLAIELAAREAARAAAVSAEPAAAARLAAERVTSLRPLQVAVSAGVTTVTVTVRYTSATDVALIGRLIGDVPMTASVTMAVEPP